MGKLLLCSPQVPGTDDINDEGKPDAGGHLFVCSRAQSTDSVGDMSRGMRDGLGIPALRGLHAKGERTRIKRRMESSPHMLCAVSVRLVSTFQTVKPAGSTRLQIA